MELITDFFERTEGPHRRRINPRDSRDAGNEIRRGLGPRRNFELQTTPFGTSIFHPQRFTCPDRVRDFSERAALNSAAPGGWRTSAGLWKRQRLRGTRSIPAQRRNRSAARAGFAAGEIRSTQTKIGSGRVIRSGAEKSCCRNFRNVSELSLRRAGLQSATFSTSCGGARAELKF